MSVAVRRKYGLKILSPEKKGPWSGWQWPEIGEWTAPIDKLVMCREGYHLTPIDGLVAYIATTMRDSFVSFDVYLAEWDGDESWGSSYLTGSYYFPHVADKFVCTRSRLLKQLSWDAFDWKKWLGEDYPIKRSSSYTFWEAARRFSACVSGTAGMYDPIRYAYNSTKGQPLMLELIEKWGLQEIYQQTKAARIEGKND
jgi:hypothetical protein